MPTLKLLEKRAKLWEKIADNRFKTLGITICVLLEVNPRTTSKKPAKLCDK